MLLIFLLPLLAMAQTPESVNCPADTLKVDYQSPVSGLRKIVCTKNQAGQNIPVGNEYVFDKNGKFLADKSRIQHVPGTEESSIKPQNATVSSALRQLLQLFSRKTLEVKEGFRVSQCDRNPMEWIKMALTKQPQTFQYKFQDGCDVEGTFTANFGQEFPLNLNLRNLFNYKQTQMTVLQQIQKGQKGIRYRFEAISGKLTSSAEKVEFTAWYEVELDILNGSPIHETQDGRVKILKVNDQPVNLEERLVY